MVAALAGIRVLDFGAYLAGPYGPKMLGDLGADVIKIEPVEGESMRAPISTFFAAQRGKRCIALDLKSSEAQEIIRKLVATADIIAHNMRLKAVQRLGITYEDCVAIKPDIVYLSAPGWGNTGPKADLPSFAPLFSGYCGIQWNAAGRGNPPIGAVGNEDYFNSLMGAGLALMGLLRRMRTTRGVHVIGPQFNSTLFATSEVLLDLKGERIFDFTLDSDQTGLSALYRLYRTSDHWICVAICREKDWSSLISIDAFSRLRLDARFSDASRRHANDESLSVELEQIFAVMTSEEAFAMLDGAGTPCEIPRDVCFGEYLFDEDNVRAGRVVEYEDPKLGRMRCTAQTIHLSETPGTIRARPPLLGEHTREILAELGYDAPTIGELRRRGIVNWEELPPRLVR